jgi:hypothetical protein
MGESGNLNGSAAAYSAVGPKSLSLLEPVISASANEQRSERSVSERSIQVGAAAVPEAVSDHHAARRMRVSGVMDSELRSLTFVNTAMTALLSLGTGCLGFVLGLKSSVAVADKVPEATAALLKVVEPSITGLGVALYFFGVIAWITRIGYVSTIKRESNPELRQAPRERGKFGRIWLAVRS